MLEKSRQARQSLLLRSPPSSVEPYDELAIFGGRSGLVLPKGHTPNPMATSSAHTSIPLDPNPFLLPTMPSLMPDARTPTDHGFSSALGDPQQLYYMDDEDLNAPDAWERLYREVPEPSYSYGAGVSNANVGLGATGPANPPGEAMLEDRWSTFMHQYTMTGSRNRQ